MNRFYAALACSLLGVMVGACGAGDRPPAAGEVADEASEAVPLVPARPRSGTAVRACEPGTPRDCLLTYIEGNRKNCFQSTQFCKANGTGWLACGEPAEPPLPPASPDEDEDAGAEDEPLPLD